MTEFGTPGAKDMIAWVERIVGGMEESATKLGDKLQAEVGRAIGSKKMSREQMAADYILTVRQAPNQREAFKGLILNFMNQGMGREEAVVKALEMAETGEKAAAEIEKNASLSDA